MSGLCAGRADCQPVRGRLAGPGPVLRGRRDEILVVERRELAATAQRELLEDVGEVRFHRRFGDREAVRRLPVAQAARDESDDLLLALAQAALDRRLYLPGSEWAAGGQLLDGERQTLVCSPTLHPRGLPGWP